MLHSLSSSAAISFSPFWSCIFRIIYRVVPVAFIEICTKKGSFFNGTTSSHAKDLWVQEDIHGRDSLAERKERKKRKHAGKVEDILRDEWREARHRWGKRLSMGFGWQKKCALLHGNTWLSWQGHAHGCGHEYGHGYGHGHGYRHGHGKALACWQEQSRQHRHPCVPSNTRGFMEVLLGTELLESPCVCDTHMEPPSQLQGLAWRSGSWGAFEHTLQGAALLIVTPISNPASKPAPFIYILTYDSFN